MYIYLVTNLSNKKFYISYTTDDKSKFSSIKNVDPYSKFDLYLSNGRTKILNVEKRLLYSDDDLNSLLEVLAMYAKQYTTNPNFIGIITLEKNIITKKLLKKTNTELLEVVKIVKDIVEQK
jgi:hypothetical protein